VFAAQKSGNGAGKRAFCANKCANGAGKRAFRARKRAFQQRKRAFCAKKRVFYARKRAFCAGKRAFKAGKHLFCAGKRANDDRLLRDRPRCQRDDRGFYLAVFWLGCGWGAGEDFIEPGWRGSAHFDGP